MRYLWRAAIVSVLIVVLLTGAIGGIRWARRGGSAASFAANALLLTLGMGLVTTPPQRGVQQVQEEGDKTGSETGDPPLG
jgi:hypothetical protein